MVKELPNLGPDFVAEVSSSMFMLEDESSYVYGRKAHKGSTAALRDKHTAVQTLILN